MPIPEFKGDKDIVSFAKKTKLPSWQERMFKRNSDAVKTHSQGNIFFKINSLFPNEHPESQKHRIMAFESITEPSFGRAANNVNRIFKNSSFSVDQSDRSIEYLSKKYPGINFFTWFLDNWVNVALKTDPNALIVVYPKEYVDKGNDLCCFVGSENIRYLGEDGVLFVSEKESEVEYTLEEKNVSLEKFYDQSINLDNFKPVEKNTFTPQIKAQIKKTVFHFFINNVGFYRIEELKKKTEKGEDYSIEFYAFKKETRSYVDVGGETGELKINKSFLHPFVPFGNLALLQHSQHTAVNFMFSFPRMSEMTTPCNAEGCNEGKIQCETAEDKAKYGDTKNCIACNGSGYMTNQTPYKVYTKRFDPQGMAGDPSANKYLEVPDVQFYTPDSSILDYSKNEWQGYLEKAETAVYIQQRVKTGNVEAAKSKEIDREDLYSFLSKVGQCYFARLKFVLQAVEESIGSGVSVSISVPYSYAILTEGEAYSALKDILSSVIPVMLKASQVESFISKFVSQSSPLRKFIDILKVVDPLLYYTNTDISGFKANNIITAEQYANHVFAYPVLQKIYNENKELFLNDTDKIIDKLNKELEAYKPKEQPGIKDKFINQV